MTVESVEPICPSIDPVTLVQCQRTHPHRGRHWAVFTVEDGGRVTAEWRNPEEIRAFFKKLTLNLGETDG